MVEEYILNQLSPEEKIEYEHKVGGINWIATNKRLLKFKKNLVGDKTLRDLDYKHLVSIDLEEKRAWGVLFFGLFLILLSFSFKDYSVILVSLGILMTLSAIFYKNAYYQFNASSIKLEEWKMQDTKSKESKELIQVVRKHCFFDNKEK
ncbi:MAG: hypothetical protein V1660_02240 [archaeon]